MTRSLQLARIYLAPAGGLLLWLGVYAAAWFSVDSLAPERLSNKPLQAAMVQERPQPDEQDASYQAPIPKDDSHPTGQQAVAEKPSDPKPIQSPPPQRSNPRPNMTPQPGTKSPNPSPTPTPVDAERTAERPVENEENDDETPSQQRVAAAPAAETNGASENESDEPAVTEPAQPPARATPQIPPASEHIARAQLTSGISQREPIDRVDGVFLSEQKPLRRIYYFTEIKGLRGETVTHHWRHEGRLMAKVKFRIGSNSWRAYSSKKLIPSMTGPWQVIVTDSQGNTLSTARFVYKAS